MLLDLSFQEGQPPTSFTWSFTRLPSAAVFKIIQSHWAYTSVCYPRHQTQRTYVVNRVSFHGKAAIASNNQCVLFVSSSLMWKGLVRFLLRVVFLLFYAPNKNVLSTAMKGKVDTEKKWIHSNRWAWLKQQKLCRQWNCIALFVNRKHLGCICLLLTPGCFPKYHRRRKYYLIMLNYTKIQVLRDMRWKQIAASRLSSCCYFYSGSCFSRLNNGRMPWSHCSGQGFKRDGSFWVFFFPELCTGFLHGLQ